VRLPTYARHASACLLLVACISTPAPSLTLGGPSADLKASTAELYLRYGAALSGRQRGSLARFYHHDGALIVFNGRRLLLTRSAIDSTYGESWAPPEYFAWDDLAYDSIGPGLVVVTGGFRLKSRGRSDTTRFIYAALLEAVDSGMAIRFEHETARPPR
jgi:hypothetical protein